MAVKTASFHRRHRALDPPLFFQKQSRPRGMVNSGHFTPFGEFLGRVSPGRNRLVIVRDGQESSDPANSLEKRMARKSTQIMLSPPRFHGGTWPDSTVRDSEEGVNWTQTIFNVVLYRARRDAGIDPVA